MQNKHIEVVKKWLADKTSVSSEELRANARAAADDAAHAAHAAAYAASYAADDAARAAHAAADGAADGAAYWVKRYEEMTLSKGVIANMFNDAESMEIGDREIVRGMVLDVFHAGPKRR